MLAAGTRSPGVMVVGEVPEPEPPGPRDVIVRPEAVGICGSDLHFYTGDTGALSGARSFFPRVQGHEFSAIIEQLGRDSSPRRRSTSSGRAAPPRPISAPRSPWCRPSGRRSPRSSRTASRSPARGRRSRAWLIPRPGPSRCWSPSVARRHSPARLIRRQAPRGRPAARPSPRCRAAGTPTGAAPAGRAAPRRTRRTEAGRPP